MRHRTRVLHRHNLQNPELVARANAKVMRKYHELYQERSLNMPSAAEAPESEIQDVVRLGRSGTPVQTTSASNRDGSNGRIEAKPAPWIEIGRRVIEQPAWGENEDSEGLRRVCHRELKEHLDDEADDSVIEVMSNGAAALGRHSAKAVSTPARPQNFTSSQDTESTPVYSSHADDPEDSDYYQSTHSIR